MNSKYSISRFATGTLAAVAALLSTTACHDDFGYQNEAGQRIAFKLTAAEAWHNGMSVNENAPTTRCTSVQELSGDGDTQLYLHTVVADNPVAEPALTSRGTPIKTTEAFKDTYDEFSLSGILVTDGEVDNLTPKFAHNLKYSTTTGLRTDGDQLSWPWTGSVHYFAFAPTIASFGENSPLEISEASHLGAPILTYTVPTDVTKQVDLMTATKIATLPSENLEFKHALTAVQIKCGKDMLAGKITEVTISGIYGTGSLAIGSDTWTFTDKATAEYKITQDITLSPSTDEDVADKTHAPEGTPIVGTDKDNLTFLLLPQVLPDGAAMTIKFTDDVSKTERTLTGSIAGQTWEAGKIVTYSISPSSIHISAKIDFSKNGITDKNPTGDIMPYSGVWYDVQYKPAKVEIVQAGVDTKQIAEIPIDQIKFKYTIYDDAGNIKTEGDCTTDANGLLTIAPQPAYALINGDDKFDKTSENGTVSNPFSLSDEKGETANCYLVDQAGYYSLPLVYGNCNGSVPDGNTNALNYYPSYDDNKPITAGTIPGASDAVLCWQDSPDLIDPKSVGLDENKKNLVFHIRKETLAQGNALLAVRNSAKEILWSWHIWVTPYKDDFYSDFFHSKTYKNNDGKGESTPLKEYDFAKYNLGWCDRHDHNASRTFSLRAVVDMSAYGGGENTSVDIGTFTQDVFKGSDAGDNTYYQWGRKDPMLGGIYNTYTPCYSYTKKGTKLDSDEFTMENKQVFNQYKECDEAGNVVYDYSFCKNPGDMITALYPSIDATASKGVTIGYSIQHPYMFITNSTENGTDGSTTFNYRNHWHSRYVDKNVGYLSEDTHIMFNAWDAGATRPGASDNSDANNYYNNVFDSNGIIKESVMVDYMKSNAAEIRKSVYDPCPPKFKVPPIDAFRGIAAARGSNDGNYALGEISYLNNAWTIKKDGGSITFPMTGVRNYALRTNEWKTVTGLSVSYEDFYKISMPAFKMLTFVSSATIASKGEYNAYQLVIFAIDKNIRTNDHDKNNVKMSCYSTSSNSYGLPVRPIKDGN